mmetsp:Transcript_47303/g.101288  ORF Transcript_47303/g.101288 Transcript_47303/m.101288 type:complete len:84 (+) Transcript_47303:801-1052(+)
MNGPQQVFFTQSLAGGEGPAPEVFVMGSQMHRARKPTATKEATNHFIRAAVEMAREPGVYPRLLNASNNQGVTRPKQKPGKRK